MGRKFPTQYNCIQLTKLPIFKYILIEIIFNTQKIYENIKNQTTTSGQPIQKLPILTHYPTRLPHPFCHPTGKCKKFFTLLYLNSEFGRFERASAEFCAEAQKSGPETRSDSKKGEAMK